MPAPPSALDGRDVAVALAVVAAVLVASPLHLPLNNPNEGVRVFATKALVEHHTFAIDDVVAAWGYIDDKAARDGHLYSSKAPLVSLFAAAGYAVIHPVTGDLDRPTLTRVCRGFGDVLPSLLLAFVLWRSLRCLTRDAVVADLVVIGTVLGTGVLSSLNVFSGHALAALGPAAAVAVVAAVTGVTGGVTGVTGVSRGSTSSGPARLRSFAVVGAALATATCAEYPAVLVCAPIAVVAVLHKKPRDALRRIGAVVAGAAPIVVVTAVAHDAMFGAPWRTGYSFLENRAYRDVVQGTLFGVGAPDFAVLGRVLFSSDVGLFFFSPLLVVGAVAAAVLVRDRSRRALAIAIGVGVVLMMAFIAGYRGWRGGWSVGPRYILEIAGLLALPTALAFDAWSTKSGNARVAARATLTALVVVGVLHSGVAGAFFPHLSDVFANPVYEMLLPTVARGFAPDSIPLALGAPPAAAAVVVVVALFLPVVVALLFGEADDARGPDARERRRRPRPDRSLAISVGAGAASIVVALSIGPGLTFGVGGEARAAQSALEARRMLDNWRPEEGNPLLVDGGAKDAHTLVAVDRARAAWPIAMRDGCAPLMHDDVVGALANLDVIARAPGTLVVVPDRYALDLSGVRASPNLFVTSSDFAKNAKAGIPCAGNVFAIEPLSPALSSRMREVERHESGGFTVVELERSASAAAASVDPADGGSFYSIVE